MVDFLFNRKVCLWVVGVGMIAGNTVEFGYWFIFPESLVICNIYSD